MNLYKTHSNDIDIVKEKPFKLEREIQSLFESNLNKLMNLQLVKSEFSIKNRRIDTLAYDKQSNAFIIIEYKRSKNISVVDQGFTYLALMLENKADFIVEYNETLKQNIKRTDVDWSQTRVVFVSTGFTENQRTATNFKDIAIELWEVKRYENNLISVNQIKKSKSAESIKPITSSNKQLDNITKEIKVYSEEDHTANKSDEIIELYEIFRDAIVNLADNIEVTPRKLRIAFKIGHRVVCDIHLQKHNLKLWINLKRGILDDPKKLMNDVSNKGHWGSGDYELKTTDTKDLEYILSLIKQSIKNNQ
jgi:predicted transport protein